MFAETTAYWPKSNTSAHACERTVFEVFSERLQAVQTSYLDLGPKCRGTLGVQSVKSKESQVGSVWLPQQSYLSCCTVTVIPW